nr:translation initiation factor IF-2-like [Symphalangus syndactylus]
MRASPGEAQLLPTSQGSPAAPSPLQFWRGSAAGHQVCKEQVVCPPNLAICGTYVPAAASLSRYQLRPGELGGPGATPVTFKARSRLLAPQDPAPAPPAGSPPPYASSGLPRAARSSAGRRRLRTRRRAREFPTMHCSRRRRAGRGRGNGAPPRREPWGPQTQLRPRSRGRSLGSGRATARSKSHLGLPEAGGGSRSASPLGQGAPWSVGEGSVGGCAGLALKSEGSQLWEEGTAFPAPKQTPRQQHLLRIFIYPLT